VTIEGVVEVAALCTVTAVPPTVDEESKFRSPEYAADIECGLPDVE
jgi:hypothetical protein